jgi:hypothetical protein
VAYSRINQTYLRGDANAVNLEGTATGQVARVLLCANHLHDKGGGPGPVSGRRPTVASAPTRHQATGPASG